MSHSQSFVDFRNRSLYLILRAAFGRDSDEIVPVACDGADHARYIGRIQFDSLRIIGWMHGIEAGKLDEHQLSPKNVLEGVE
jgi:hypothetical protein